jgi:hypothetical protein
VSEKPEGKTVKEQLKEILGRDPTNEEIIQAFDQGTNSLLRKEADDA